MSCKESFQSYLVINSKRVGERTDLTQQCHVVVQLVNLFLQAILSLGLWRGCEETEVRQINTKVQCIDLLSETVSVQIKHKIDKTCSLFSDNVNTTIRKYSSRAFI